MAALPSAAAVLATLDLMPMTTRLLDDAAAIGEAGFRSLDAIHLASAVSIRSSLAAFVVYDHRLAEAAATAGIDVAAPNR